MCCYRNHHRKLLLREQLLPILKILIINDPEYMSLCVSNPASLVLFDIILGLARIGKEIQPPRINPPRCTAITHSKWWALLFERFPGNSIFSYQNSEYWLCQVLRGTNTVAVQMHPLTSSFVIFYEAFNLYWTEQNNVQFGESYKVKIMSYKVKINTLLIMSR